MFYRLFYPRQSCFLTARDDGKTNVTLVDWVMPVSVKPPMLAVSLNNKSFSLDLLAHSKEFCVGVLPGTFVEKAMVVGSTTGKLIDKIDEFSIALEKAGVVDAPLVKGALASVECRVMQILGAGDHSLVVGEVVETRFPDDEAAREAILFNWGSKNYFGLSKDILREARESREGRDGSTAPAASNGKEGSKDGKEAGREGRENGKEAGRESGKDGKEAGKESAKDVSRESARDAPAALKEGKETAAPKESKENREAKEPRPDGRPA